MSGELGLAGGGEEHLKWQRRFSCYYYPYWWHQEKI